MLRVLLCVYARHEWWLVGLAAAVAQRVAQLCALLEQFCRTPDAAGLTLVLEELARATAASGAILRRRLERETAAAAQRATG